MPFDFMVDNVTVQNDVPLDGGNSLEDRVCPYDLFASELRQLYSEMLARDGDVTSENASCGSVEQSIPGTMSGQWWRDDVFALTAAERAERVRLYREGRAPEQFGPGISVLAYPNRPRGVRIGGIEPNVIASVDPGDLPAAKGVGDEVCYEDSWQREPSVILRLPEAGRLELVHFTGSCDSPPASQEIRVYRR